MDAVLPRESSRYSRRPPPASRHCGSKSKGATVDDQATFVRSDRDGRATLVVAGEIDLVTAPFLRDELAAVIGDAGSTTVVDLSGVTFIDSSGLGALIDARSIID